MKTFAALIAVMIWASILVLLAAASFGVFRFFETALGELL